MGAHEVTYFQHNCPKLLIIPGDRGTLPQVKQAGLIAQCVVQVTELGFQGMAEILPCTNP